MKVPEPYKHLIYIKSARTGGTSLLKALENSRVCVSYLRTIDSYKPGDLLCIPSDSVFRAMDVIPHVWRDAYVFSIVRNPYTKVASGYSYHPACQGMTLADLLETPPPVPSVYELDWKRELPRSKWPQYSLYNHVMATQSEFLFNEGEALFNRILRFESLVDDLGELFGQLGVDLKMPHVNRAGHEHSLSEEEKRLIEQRYCRDFENFAYSIERYAYIE